MKGSLPLPTVSGAPGDHGIFQMEKGRFVAVLSGSAKRWNQMEPKHQTQTPKRKEKSHGELRIERRSHSPVPVIVPGGR